MRRGISIDCKRSLEFYRIHTIPVVMSVKVTLKLNDKIDVNKLERGLMEHLADNVVCKDVCGRYAS